MQRSKGLAALILIAALLIGGALGFAIARVSGSNEHPMKAGGSARYWDKIAQDWKLNPQQRVVIDSLLDVQQQKMSVLYQPLIKAMDSASVHARAISDSTQAAMREVLNEEQRAKLDILRKETRQRAEERRANRLDWWRKVQ